jgi:hypothetical protein
VVKGLGVRVRGRVSSLARVLARRERESA